MTDYLFTLGLLAVPLFICRLRTGRRGLVTGLFLSLCFWGQADILLFAVPFSAAALLCLKEKKENGTENDRLSEKKQLYVLNPSVSMLALFAAAMIIFCAFGDAFYHYGAYLMLNEKVLTVSRQLSFSACLLGPLAAGSWCDRKGPFSAAIALTLAAEFSVLLASAGDASLLFYVLGSFLVSLCISGFFVLLPLIASAYFGAANFHRFYPIICGFAAVFWSIARYQYTSKWAVSANPGGFLLSLIFLTFISACFIYTAWKRRFVLVSPAACGQKVR